MRFYKTIALLLIMFTNSNIQSYEEGDAKNNDIEI